MKIRELFVHDVTRNIPPVVYFHEQSPERIAAEVSEYIVTGGFTPDDPRHRRVPEGIHEAYVKLLTRMREAIERPGGAELPASWISGSYGSGKSSFAKLLGLALGGVMLPDGTSLAKALVRRDDSPRAEEFVAAWDALASKVRAKAVVFDIGGVARDDEHIHVAALRQIQGALGYCRHSERVAEFELMLETDGRWDAFLRAAQEALGRPWSAAMHEALAQEHFSHVLHVLDRERYLDPMSWADAHVGKRSGAGTSVSEVVESIGRMLQHRAPDATLFVVVDEVSQYIHQDEGRMLKLQSFVSELGQRLRGRVWLLATGQQKLEDQADSQVLSKLKDRFPPALRVHLTNSNIRDVVHKRLLQKRNDREAELRAVFQEHRPDLTLNALDGQAISEVEFMEVYPMLPWHVDVLLQITSALRLRSSRAQADDQTLRGLIQLLGELFRERQFAEREVGDLVTFDEIYEVQRTALDDDLQNSLAVILRHKVVEEDPMTWRVARAVALLQQIQDQTPTDDKFIARSLYARVGQGSQLPAVAAALDRLKAHNLVSYSEKEGYKIQSSAGQEWQRERDDYGVTRDVIAAIARDQLKTLLALPDRPKLKGRPLAWSAWFSDEQYILAEHIVTSRTQDAEAPLDFRLPWTKEGRSAERWVVESSQGENNDRVVWVAGEPGQVENVAREYARSRKMVERYNARRSSLPRDRQGLLLAEETRYEELGKKVKEAVAAVFLEGAIWFRGRAVRPKDKATTFGPVVLAVTEETLPKLYPSFTDIAVLPKELEQLVQKELSGPSAKFLDGALGILSLDSGRYVPTCAGAVPTAVLQRLEAEKGLTGGDVLGRFAKPPYGWPADVVKACLAGLLRAGKVSVQTAQDTRITSVRDVGVQDLFSRDRDFRQASFFAGSGTITQRDRVAICKFFEERLNATLDRENDAIADAVWAHFPTKRAQLKEVEQRLQGLGLSLSPTLGAYGRALERCQSRRVEEIVLAVKESLDVLRDGIDEVAVKHGGLTDATLALVREARAVEQGELKQLDAVGRVDDVKDDAEKLRQQLAQPAPWIGVNELKPSLERLRAHYRASRTALLTQLNARVEQARAGVQSHSRFATLTADERHAALRPFQFVLPDTSPDALTPSLEELDDRFQKRLTQAEEEAHRVLDTVRAEKDKVEVTVLRLNLRGREIGTESELDVALQEIRERILTQLRAGMRVRLG